MWKIASKYKEKCDFYLKKTLEKCDIWIYNVIMLRRKVDDYLIQWKNNPDRLPLVIKGARQIGKTFSVRNFAKSYKNFIEINFITDPQFKTVFKNGYSPESIIREITLLRPDWNFIPNETLILFDEIQVFPDLHYEP